MGWVPPVGAAVAFKPKYLQPSYAPAGRRPSSSDDDGGGAGFVPPLPKHRRASRAGQTVARNPLHHDEELGGYDDEELGGGAYSDEDGGDEEGSSDDSEAAGAEAAAAGPAKKPASFKSWTERKQDERAAWLRDQGARQDERLRLAHYLDDAQQTKAAAVVAAVQHLINGSWQVTDCKHCRTPLACWAPTDGPRVVARHRKLYYTYQCCAPVEVPTWACSSCGQLCPAQPSGAGCFPSSPSDPRIWFDDVVHQGYSHMGLHEGTGSTGWMAMLDKLHAHQSAASVKAERYLTSFVAWLSTTSTQRDPANFGMPAAVPGDPMKDCLICAADPEMPAKLAYRPSVAIDGVTKPCHYANCGATCNLPPLQSKYFAGADAEVLKLHRAGELNLNTLAPRGAADGDDDGDGDDEGAACACSTNLHAARQDAGAPAGTTDINGMLGTTCAHIIPLLNAFVDLYTPESFSYYLVVIDKLLEARPDLKDVYVDFGCRLWKTWQRYVKKQGQKLQEADIRIMVNWLHGASHELSCELKNSAKFHEDAGRRIGEHTELLWALIKDLSGIVRYMTKGNRRDFLEAALAEIAYEKRCGLDKLLAKRVTAANKLIREHEKAFDAAKAAAEEAEVDDVDAAADEFRSKMINSKQVAESDWKVTYVRLLLRKDGLEALASGSAASLMARPSNPKELATVDRKLSKLEVDQGILPHQRWRSGHAMYTAALHDLVEREVERCLAQIHCSVADIMRMRTKKDRAGTASTETRRLSSAERRRRGRVVSILQELQSWQRAGGRAVQTLSSEQVKQLLCGKLDLDSVGLSSKGVERLVHGRAFLYAREDLRRTTEELGLLRIERLRLAWRLQRMEKQAVAAQGQGAAPRARAQTGPLTPEELLAKHAMPSRAEGRAWLLSQELRRIRAMLLVVDGIPRVVEPRAR